MTTADTVIIYDGGLEGKWPRGLSDFGSIGQPATVFCGRLIDPTMSRETRLHQTNGASLIELVREDVFGSHGHGGLLRHCLLQTIRRRPQGASKSADEPHRLTPGKRTLPQNPSFTSLILQSISCLPLSKKNTLVAEMPCSSTSWMLA